MREEITLNGFTVFIFLGVFQGLILSYFFIVKGSRKNLANIYQGLLLFALTCSIFEEFLNETGYIVKVLHLSNFAEPFNFAFGPLLYLFIKRSLNPNSNKYDYLHFIPFILWTAYSVFHYIQPIEAKYNSYLFSKHPDWPMLSYDFPVSDSPWGIRQHINLLTAFYSLTYIGLVIQLIHKKLKSLGQSFFTTDNETLISVRNSSFHFTIIIFIFIIAKVYFGRDIGDYYISTYISFLFILTTFQIFNDSSYFERNRLFMEIKILKYSKSSLTAERKNKIEKKIKLAFEKEKYHLNNLASLSNLSKKLNETNHHVSQVINENLGMSFFELLARYRVEEAKTMISKDGNKKITIEELAERVGYNSKSAFNNAFKKITSLTPSEYRENPKNYK